MNSNCLPLFPLATVLFPGSRLSLRIFEPRYLDLIRDCARNGVGFGVCLILDGSEAGAPAVPAAFGCEAHIVDFSTTDQGLLGIVVQGARRFHVEHSRVRGNGLIVAEVTWLAAPPAQRIRPEFQLLATLLQRILDRAEMPFSNADLEDADWVGWRLAEWLPLAVAERQALLQENDPHGRLQRLVEQLPQLQQD